MEPNLEKERKFLIKLPLGQEAKEVIIDRADAPANIVQTYVQVDEGVSERIRMITVEMWGNIMPPHYTHTIKRYVSPGVNEEIEDKINFFQYSELLMKSDLCLNEIEKTRYFVTWDGKIFELDIFHGALKGLAILEIELTDMDEKFELPPFLEVIKEVTGDKNYSNASLAKKKN